MINHKKVQLIKAVFETGAILIYKDDCDVFRITPIMLILDKVKIVDVILLLSFHHQHIDAFQSQNWTYHLLRT